MGNFKIITDSSCDLTQKLADELDLRVVPLSVLINDKEYVNYLDGREISFTDYYAMLRKGMLGKTSAPNVFDFTSAMEEYLKKGMDILYLGFSSALSGTYNAGVIAADELKAKYPERKIITIDTLCASLGQGMMIYLAVKKKEEGASIEEVAEYVENNKLHLCHWFTVDDLNHLKRGGRVSAVEATFGTILNIKPVMHVDNAGRLIAVEKVRGRKASLNALIKMMKETVIDKSVAFISHGDCYEEAKALADKIREEVGIEDIRINYVGPVIGTHSGPGTMALFFLGEER